MVAMAGTCSGRSRLPQRHVAFRGDLGASSPVTHALRGLVTEQRADGPAAGVTSDRSTDMSAGPYPAVLKAGILVGFVLNLVFLVVAVPFGRQLGGFGVLWSIMLVLIFGYNVWHYLIRNRRRW